MNQRLPITDVIPDIKKALNLHNRLVLEAPPGAGKTTLLPLELIGEPWLKGKKIIMLEPRRIAARSAAYWMAKCINQSLGEGVGYSVHLDKKVSDKTVLEVVTEGVFLKRLIREPELKDIALVIFDEFHERNLNTDLSLALLKESQEVLRQDIKILVMSATLDSKPVSDYLDGCPIITSSGRSFPVDIKYFWNENLNLVDLTLKAVTEALNSERGSLLVFLPGVGEIKRLEERLRSRVPEDVKIFPLYGALSREEQERAIEPIEDGETKVVLSTPIAESSITIKGIRVVIDSGLVRKPLYSSKTGMDRLETMDISKSSAIQRSGRAGRIEPGITYRLWNKNKKLEEFTDPGIVCEDLTSLVLTLYKWGYSSIDDILWLTNPDKLLFEMGRELLERLGAIEGKHITKLGEELIKLPLHPRLGALLTQGRTSGVEELAADLAALLSERDILSFSRESYQSDILYRLDVIQGKKIVGATINRAGLKRVRDYSRSLKPENETYDQSLLSSLLIKAFPDRVAKRVDHGKFQLVNGESVTLDQWDTLYYSDFLVVPNLGGVGRESRVFLAVEVARNEIMELLKNSLKVTESLRFNENKESFSGVKEYKLGVLVLKEERLRSIPEERVADALISYLKESGLKKLNWGRDLQKFRERVNFLYKKSNKSLDLSDENLMKELSWLRPYLGGFTCKSSLKDIPLGDAIRGMFSYKEIEELNRCVPTHIVVPSGSKIPLDYSTGEPILKVRLQELFGLLETPRVLNNYPVTIHLLSPASRPIQITRDLKSFWDSTYSEVKKDLKGRYPKHYWPDNPYEAEATNRVKRKK